MDTRNDGISLPAAAPSAKSPDGKRSNPQSASPVETSIGESSDDQVPLGSLPDPSSFSRSNVRPGAASNSSLAGGPAIGSSSRPQTSAGRSSRTHVPSIASHAFFRPMSSQRLQAQRGGRPSTSGQTISSNESQNDSASNFDGGSVISDLTATQRRHEHETLPPSRGTDMISRDQASLNTNANTARSIGESTRPLQPAHEQLSPKRSVRKHYSGGRPLSSPPPNYRSASRSDQPFPSETEHHEESFESLAGGIEGKMSALEDTNSGKNYQYFPGNTFFCFGGRLQNSRDRPINVLTFLLTIVPCVLFLVFSGPYYWHNISPAVPIIFGYLSFLCLSSFLHASASDPGILPRNLHPPPTGSQSDDPFLLGPILTEWTTLKASPWGTEAMDFPTKFCQSCQIWRPPRAHHCRICDNCIETQDHHCVWLNNCVGRRNYRYFLSFVTTAAILGLFLAAASLAQCLHYRSHEGVSFGAAIDQSRVVFAMFIYGLCIAPYPAALLIYHLFLMGRGETTHEYLNSYKLLKKDRYRPFDQHSLLRNWLTVMLRPRSPTYLRFKDRFVEGDTRFGARRTRAMSSSNSGTGDGSMELKGVGSSSPTFQGTSSRVKVENSMI